MKNFISILVILLLGACNIINPDEDQPVYMTVEPFALSGNGLPCPTHKIVDGWIYVGNDFIGAYTLPVTVPVLTQGEQQIDVFPGIKVSGVSSIPEIYPFYKQYTTSRDFQPEMEITIAPTTSYVDEAQFLLIEKFSDSNHQLQVDYDGDPETRIDVTSAGSLDGLSGSILLNADHPSFAVGTIALTELTTISNTFYVELDYRTDVAIDIGLVGYSATGMQVYSDFDGSSTPGRISPNTEWNKIYQDLSLLMTEMKQVTVLSYYEVVLAAQFDPANAAGAAEARIYLDNIKVLLF